MYNYEKNREQVVNDLDRVIKLIHMKADEIPEEEKAQMVKETVEHFNSYVSPGWINYRKCISSETEGNAVLEWEDGGSYFRGLYDNEVFLDAMGGFGIYVAGHSEDLIIDTVKAQLSPTRATLPGTHRSPPRLPGQGPWQTALPVTCSSASSPTAVPKPLRLP